MNDVIHDHYSAELHSFVPTRYLVVVARHVNDLSAFAGLAEDLLDDIVMFLGPEIPGRFQTPAIDDIAHEIKLIGFVVAEEIEQESGFASPSAQMDVGDPDGAV